MNLKICFIYILASSYDIRYNNNGINLLQLLDNARKLPAELIIHNKGPKEAGERELMILKMPVAHNQSASFAFIIRAVDKEGNVGEFSNLATVGLYKTRYVVVKMEKERKAEEPVVLLIAVVMVVLFVAMMLFLIKASMRRGSQKMYKNHCSA